MHVTFFGSGAAGGGQGGRGFPVPGQEVSLCAQAGAGVGCNAARLPAPSCSGPRLQLPSSRASTVSSAKWAVHILHIGNDVCIFCISVILVCIFCIFHAILSNIMKTCILLAYFAYCFAYFFAYSAY